MPNPKLLLISYVFPPAGGVAVLRALSLAKYLPGFGNEVHVLTAANPAAPVQDPGLLRHVPPQVRVHRCFTPELPFYFRKKLWSWFAGGRNPAGAGRQRRPATGDPESGLGALVKKILCPDPQVLWVPFAQRRAAQIVKKYGIDAVIVTAPPFSVFLTGAALKRRFPHIQLVSDFRDEWLRFYLADFEFLNNDYTRRRAEAIERETIECSDLVVAVTGSSLSEIRKRYPQQPDAKFMLLPNGFDPEVFSGFTPRPHGASKIVMAYLGTVYKTSSPASYLDALDGLPEEVRSCFETRFVGRIAESENATMERRRSPIRLLGFLPQEQAIRQAEEADYLLLIMNNDFMLPGKLFDYLATGKPILAIAPPGGEIGRILKETGAGWCVDPGDRAGIQAALLRAYTQARTGGGGLLRPDAQAIRRYERKRLAGKLDAAIRSLLRDSGRIETAQGAMASPEPLPWAQMQSRR